MASGADAEEGPAPAEVEPPEVAPPEAESAVGEGTPAEPPRRGSSRRTSSMARKGPSTRMSRKAPRDDDAEDEAGAEAAEPNADAIPAQPADPVPAPEEESEEEVVPRRRGMRTGGPSSRGPANGSTVKITVNDDQQKGRRRGVRKERPPKEEKPIKLPKQRGESKPLKEPKQKPQKEPKAPRASRRKPVVDEDFDEAFTPTQPEVIVVPESIGMQLLTVIEAVAGAAIVFFGATQVGNILITKIMSGMLGG